MSVVKKGSTDVSRYIVLRDSSDGTPETGYTVTDLDLQYTRSGAAPSAKADISAVLAATNSAHSDNQAIEIDSTSSPGLYRIDWPDAAFATGVDKVILVVTGTGLDPAVEEVQLVNYDPEDGVRLGLTALPNAAADDAGGLPISDAGGLDMDSLSTLTEAQVNAQCDTALSDYGANTTTPPTAASIADAVWDEASTGHTDAGKAGAQMWTDVDAILADTADLQANQGAWATATGFATAAAQTTMQGNITDILADTNELQTDDVPGLIGALNDFDPANDTVAHVTLCDTITTYTDNVKQTADHTAAIATVDSNVDAIKAKTDNLTFTATSILQADVQYVNAVQLTGTGVSGDEWGPV